MASRMADLLTKAADAIDDGQVPLHVSFLREHEVTLDECVTLADNIALGARLLAYAHEHPKRFGTAMRGAADAMTMERITETLRAMNVEAGR